MSHLHPVASMLAVLPPRKFEKALQWLTLLEAYCRSGTWKANLSEVDVATVDCDAGVDEEAANSASTHPADAGDDAGADDVNFISDTVPQAGTDASGPPLQLTKPTRQLGRPAQQRQRLFMKKPVVFERMKTYDRDCWRLKKFVSREVALSATRTATCCETADINIDFNVSLVTDERFQLAELQKYFSPEAWDALTSHIRLSLQGNAPCGSAMSACLMRTKLVGGYSAMDACRGCTTVVLGSLESHGGISSAIAANDCKLTLVFHTVIYIV